MNVIFVRPLLVLLLVFGFARLPAQLGLSLVNVNLNIPDTVYYGDTVSFSLEVLNIGTLPLINQYIYIGEEVNGVVQSQPLDSVFISLLNPGGLVQFPVTKYVINNPKHQGGENVVVVWPYSGSGSSGNGVADTFYVDQGMKLNEDEKNGKKPPFFKVYPNPNASGWLYIDSEIEANGPESVRIFNLEGQLVYHAEEIGEVIYTGELKSGIYIMEIKGSGDILFHQKLMIE